MIIIAKFCLLQLIKMEELTNIILVMINHEESLIMDLLIDFVYVLFIFSLFWERRMHLFEFKSWVVKFRIFKND